MRKLLLVGITTLLAFNFISAQYCGNSGPNICTPANFSQPGLYPFWDSLPPFINGVPASTTIEFKNFNTIFFANQTLTIQSLKIDTISNLPSGLCWATNKTNNTFANQENGCILVSGTPCAAPGQYKLHIIVEANIGVTVTTNADAANLHYFVRLDNTGEAPTPVDSTQTDSNPINPYGPSAICGSNPVIVTIDSNQSVCSGTLVTVHTTATGGAGNYTYTWAYTGDSLSCQHCTTPNSTINQNSTFTVTVTDGASGSATASVNYTVLPLPPVALTIAVDSFCSNTGVFTLSGGSPAGGNYTVDGTT
ncbi:MAG: hypothetical protein JWO06_759, partial [Bacteroidota bacterium]|nr:hypothetical protein [Bacteroidota bacterium]